MPYRFNAFTNRLDLTDVGGGGGGTVTSFSFTNLNGFSGTVTNPTTTPNLTLSTSISNFNVIYANSGSLVGVSPGTEGQVLTAHGSAAPTWENASGGGVTTIDGDSGSITGTTVTIYAHQASNNCGETVKFVNSGSTSTLNVTDSNDNTNLGQSAGHSGQSGSENVSFGSLSLGSLQSGSNNTCVGRATNYFLTIGNSNTSIGHQACESLIDGSSNISIGSGAASTYNGSESGNINIGNNGVVGESDVTRIGANQTTCYVAGIAGNTVSNTEFVTIDTTTGQLGSAAGGGGGITEIDGDTGSTTGPIVTFDASSGTAGFSFDIVTDTVTLNTPTLTLNSSNSFVGDSSGNISVTGLFNTGLGYKSLNALSSGNQNLALGDNSLVLADLCSQNTAVGTGSLPTLNGSGSDGNVAIGFAAMQAATVAVQNTAVGLGVLQSLVDGVGNIVLGASAASAYTGTESNNIIFGAAGVVGESNVTRIGDTGVQTECYISGIAGNTVSNTEFVTIDTTTGQLGSSAGGGGGITEIDGDSGSTTGPTVTLTANGFNAGFSFDISGTTITMNNPRMTIDSNVFLGVNTGNLTLTGIANVGIGGASVGSLTTGSENIGIGAFSLNAITESLHNISIGYFSSVSLSDVSANDNIAIGFQSFLSATEGIQNLCIGSTSLFSLQTGSANIALGYGAGSNYNSSESNNVILVDAGTAGDNGVIRIGTQGLQTTCFVAGINGNTVSNTQFVTIDSTTDQLGTDSSGFSYETGTWTPEMFGASTAGVTTYNSQNGYYTKIGNMVFCGGTIDVASSTGTGYLAISLPFTVKNQTGGNFRGSVDITPYTWPSNTTNLTLAPTINDTRALIFCCGNTASPSTFMDLLLASTPTINFSVFYQV